MGALVAVKCRTLREDGRNENKQLSSSCEISDGRTWFCPGGWKRIVTYKKENSFKFVKGHQDKWKSSSTAEGGSSMGDESE